MHFTSIVTVICAAAATAAAASIPSRARRNGPHSWTLWNVTEGCSPAGCLFTFNIAGGLSQYPNFIEPAFNTTCQGSDLATEFKPCADSSVKVYGKAAGYPGWGYNMSIQHVLEEDTLNGFLAHIQADTGVVYNIPVN